MPVVGQGFSVNVESPKGLSPTSYNTSTNLSIFAIINGQTSRDLAYDERYCFSWNRKWYRWYLQISYFTCHESWMQWFPMGNIYSQCGRLFDDRNSMGSDKPYTKHFSCIIIVPYGWILWWFHHILYFLKRRFGITTGK